MHLNHKHTASVLGFLLCFAATGPEVIASGTEEPVYVPSVRSINHDHAAWTKVLSRYVTVDRGTSVVDYKRLKANQRELDSYIETLQSVASTEFREFSGDQRLAFLINAYNAFTLRLILNNYPDKLAKTETKIVDGKSQTISIRSIRNIPVSRGFSNLGASPWKDKFFKLFSDDHSLDEIEHEMIRAKFNEPRIHFAVVCASIGCPMLRAEAYVADRLKDQLEDATISFLKLRPEHRFDPKTKTLYLSSIFDWYGKDFEKTGGTVKEFVASKIASNPDEAKLIGGDDTKIKFLDYDWSLNEKK